MNILLPNNRLLDQLLSKDQSLVRPFHTLLCDDSTRSDDSTSHHPSLVVEVAEDHMDAFILNSQEIIYGDFDIIKRNERRSSSGGVTGFDCRSLDALSSLNNND